MELVNADRFIYAQLSSISRLMTATAGNLYPDVAPPDTPFPYVIWEFNSAPPRSYAIGEVATASQRANYIVRGVMEGSDWGGTLEEIAEDIKEALDRVSGPIPGIPGKLALGSRVTAPYRFAESKPEATIRHLGWNVLLVVQ